MGKNAEIGVKAGNIFFTFFLFSTFIVFFIKSVSHYKNQQRLSKSIFIILYRTENELDTIQQFIYFISFLFIAYFISSQTVMIIMAPKFEICSSLRRSGICVFCKPINQDSGRMIWVMLTIYPLSPHTHTVNKTLWDVLSERQGQVFKKLLILAGKFQ